MAMGQTTTNAIMERRAGDDEGPRANVNGAPRPRRAREILLAMVSSLFAAGALLACTPTPVIRQHAGDLDLTATRLSLPADIPAGGIGALTWLGGLELRAPDRRLGGLSGLLISPDGTRATVVSDKGYAVGFTLRHDAEGRLTGLAAGRIAPLRGPGGGFLTDKLDKDAEAMAHLRDGALAVAFEHNHRLWRYDNAEAPFSGVPVPLAPPPALNGLGLNSGIEALSELADGGLLAIAEGREDASDSPAYLWRGGRWHGLAYRRDGGFRPTGAALLPNGDILVLERFFNLLQGVRARLVRVPGAAVRPNARLSGPVLATLAPPLPLDNMEGIAVRQGPGGATQIYLISDDNYNALQRTILLHFALRE